MAKQAVKYEAEDGTKFETEEEALRYERIEQARLQCERAVTAFNRALAESFKIGDGQPFELGHTYYLVVDRLWGEDVVSLYLGHDDVKVYQEEGRLPCLVRTWYDKGYQSQEISFENLFRSRSAAMKQQLKLRRERLANLIESVAELEKELK